MLRMKTPTPDPEATAIAALGFIAADPERLARFLDMTGLGPATLRRAAAEPGFHAQVLAHILSDEGLLLAFAANAGLAPQTVAGAHERLIRPGGG